MPAEVKRRTDGNLVTYRCPECGWKIVEGVVREAGDGNINTQTPNHHSTEEPVIANRVTVATWEKWWSDRLIVSAIHGRVVAGENKLYEFVRDLRNLHDSP